MRICVFEDRDVVNLEPVALTRPVFDLRCGAETLRERQARAFAADEVGAIARPQLVDLCRLAHPGLIVNNRDWLRDGTTVLVNARWLPPPGTVENPTAPRVGVVGDEVAYVVLPAQASPDCTFAMIDDWVAGCRDTLPRAAAGGVVVRYLWDLVHHNAQALRDDLGWFRAQHGTGPRPAGLAVVGPDEALVIHPTAAVDPFVVADTRNGPVLIDRDAVVHSFSRLEGPCYIGPGSWILGAKFRGGTVGPGCRIGGEFEASIVQGYSNKYHDGFLGHSYLGEWVNLAAGTQVSDLRNDYGPVSVTVNGQRVQSGLSKVGSFLGDHTKSGLNTLLNTGTTAGVFCNLLPTGSLLPQLVPSFCVMGPGQVQERWDLRQLFATANIVMGRRGRELTATHSELFFHLYDETAAYRRKVIRESEMKRLRRSM